MERQADHSERTFHLITYNHELIQYCKKIT